MPLSARLEPWQIKLCESPDTVAGLIERHGSPLNLLDPDPMGRNARELEDAAERFGVDLKLFFARKANKALAFVDAAREHGLGVDLASERELSQALARGVPGADLIMTAAIKPLSLLELCLSSGATVAIDNEDELQSLSGRPAIRAARPDRPATRANPGPGRSPTRFGLGVQEMLAMVDRQIPDATASPLRIDGVHFHLDGYLAEERVAALSEALALIDALRARGHEPQFIDMGGGIPMSYLDSSEQWERLLAGAPSAQCWVSVRRSRSRGTASACSPTQGRVLGRANVYPYHQAPTRGGWLEKVRARLSDKARGRGAGWPRLTLAKPAASVRAGQVAARRLGVDRRPCRVQKATLRRQWLIGLAMNRTQCRSTSDDSWSTHCCSDRRPRIPGHLPARSTASLSAPIASSVSF